MHWKSLGFVLRHIKEKSRFSIYININDLHFYEKAKQGKLLHFIFQL